jgi:hypothetical protein
MTERCQICGEHRPLAIEEHHVLPRRFGGSDKEDNLIEVCSSCHSALESIYNKSFWSSVGLRPSSDQDTVEEFVQRHLDLDELHPPVPKARLYQQYQQWCEQGDVEPVSQHKFTKMLTRIEPVSAEKTYVDGHQCRCFTGVAVSSLID